MEQLCVWRSDPRPLGLDCNSVANFGYFTANEQEQSGLFNVFGTNCNVSSSTPGALAFWGRASSTISGGGGAAHFSAQNIFYSGAPMNGGYGLVYEGASTNLTISANGSNHCTTYPTAYPFVDSSGDVTNVIITYAGSGCANGSATLTCAINSLIASGSGLATCSTTVSGGVLTSISLASSTCGCYGTPMSSGGPRPFSNWTIVGADSSHLLAGGVLVDGAENAIIEGGHCEWYKNDCVRIGGGAAFPSSGDTEPLGGATGEVIGGRVSDIDSANNAHANAIVHLGTNSLSGQSLCTGTPPFPAECTLTTEVQDVSFSVQAGSDARQALVDDQHGVSLGGMSYQTVEAYHPGSLWVTDGVAVAPAMRNNSSNPTDLTGTITLSGVGTATFSLQGTYTNTPACGCWDAQDVTKACTVSVSTSVLSFSGTNNHKVSFICAGHN